jgi:hypothetical protein
MEDGLLMHYWIDVRGHRRRKVSRLVCVPAVQRLALLRAYHEGLVGGGHFSFEKTFEKVRTHFYWKSLATDVHHFCTTCDICQRQRLKRRGKLELHPLPLPKKCWRQVGMDIAGPLPLSTRGNRYILVVVDYLSRYPETVPMPNQEAEVVAQAFLDHIVARWGVPPTVITDLGTNFQAKFVQAIYQKIGVVNITSTPHHPQTDGLVERYNRTLKATLAKLCRSQSQWEEQLQWAVGNFRFCVQATLHDSPYYLMTGQDPVLPPDSWAEELSEEEGDYIDPRYGRFCSAS